MPANKYRGLERIRRGSGSRAVSRVLAVVETISFLAAAQHVLRSLGPWCHGLPFPEQMVIFQVGGSFLPLAVIGCIALVNSLFWNQDQ